MNSILSALFLLLTALDQSAPADNITEAEAFIKSNITQVIAVLEDDQLNEADRVENVHQIVTPLFDFKLMAKLSLGRNVWPGMSDEQRTRFTELFLERFKKSYLDRIFQFSGEKVRFDKARVKGGKIHVPTVLTNSEKEVVILYKLYHSENAWKIYDLEVEGVSLLLSFHNQFKEVLKTVTIDELIRNLEDSMNK